MTEPQRVLAAGDVVHYTPYLGDLELIPATFRPCQSAMVLGSHGCPEPGCLVLLVHGGQHGFLFPPVERVAAMAPGPTLGYWHLGVA